MAMLVARVRLVAAGSPTHDIHRPIIPLLHRLIDLLPSLLRSLLIRAASSTHRCINPSPPASPREKSTKPESAVRCGTRTEYPALVPVIPTWHDKLAVMWNLNVRQVFDLRILRLFPKLETLGEVPVAVPCGNFEFLSWPDLSEDTTNGGQDSMLAATVARARVHSLRVAIYGIEARSEHSFDDQSHPPAPICATTVTP
ncbi:hypothetical protein M427DRAFT_32162 [Gonapodya prolifera JEL478]|uniref:Uncharacterized protein n=1 Tax=Gonapodya prolifera (strain JEL478) TaxID=1344416 RepID=A0A139AFZ3_GONPJ|nr:hypothetical protein M427DRAFT_32162 [Gonapodya prolifera JEL478]|eukprot:KXS15742.1 hypothetical protein M427DRAFT_32162 [Gonapodya prolifera JEL478]